MDNVDGVRFRHIRYVKNDADGNPMISNMGGVTIAYKEVSPNVIRFATAECSLKDNFEKAVGRVISAGRLKSDKLSKTAHTSYHDFCRSMPNFI